MLKVSQRVINEALAPPTTPVPSQFRPRRDWSRWAKRGLLALLGLFILAVLWAAWTAPLSRSLQPTEPPTLLLLSADGQPIARRGAKRDAPVDAAKLPSQVSGAFIAIEDRRFRSHLGVDPRGLLRATWRNLRAGGVVEGGSTITQQLAKTAFLSSDRKMGRKFQEMALALWMEAWLTKDEILSRYLSTIYFGDGLYGLRAAARHYFSREPEALTAAEAAMLAGLVKSPSRLAPTKNLRDAQKRSRVVLAAMARDGVIDAAAFRALRPATLRPDKEEVPTGTYFADWVTPQAREQTEGEYGHVEVRTTLDSAAQRAAVQAVSGILDRYGRSLGVTQAALVAMRPDGRVIAMVGGRSYKASPFNRATQAKRQPGSAFKLPVYLAALESGYRPDTPVDDSPLALGEWRPENADGRYRGRISLRDAFAVSSNVAAVRIAEDVGRDTIANTARRLGITSELDRSPSMPLGTSGVTLTELTAAYAAVAGGHQPVRARGLDAEPDRSLGERLGMSGGKLDARVREDMLDLLWQAANAGTGRAAALATPTFGKTGTTQDHRDAVFVGFAGDLVTGVWVGNDDNTPMRGVTGGSLPAQIWRAFMTRAALSRDALARPARAARQEQPGALPFPLVSAPAHSAAPLAMVASDPAGLRPVEQRPPRYYEDRVGEERRGRRDGRDVRRWEEQREERAGWRKDRKERGKVREGRGRGGKGRAGGKGKGRGKG
jgi:penicillin-binding protein 1A